MAGSGPSADQVVNVQRESSISASISVSRFGLPWAHVRFRLAVTHAPWYVPEMEPSEGGVQPRLALCCVQFLQGRV